MYGKFGIIIALIYPEILCMPENLAFEFLGFQN